METVRLENKSVVTKCSLDLDPRERETENHLPHPHQGDLEAPCACKPLILDTQEKPIDTLIDVSDEKPDKSAATKLLFVMGGFLSCWIPYFIWLPTVHLLVIKMLDSRMYDSDFRIFKLHHMCIWPSSGSGT